MKKFFRVIHLYLSLAAGIVIAIVCFTGAVLVFEKELQEAFNHDRYYVNPAGQRLPLEQLVAKGKAGSTNRKSSLRKSLYRPGPHRRSRFNDA